jgi:hypothetical protein
MIHIYSCCKIKRPNDIIYIYGLIWKKMHQAFFLKSWFTSQTWNIIISLQHIGWCGFAKKLPCPYFVISILHQKCLISDYIILNEHTRVWYIFINLLCIDIHSKSGYYDIYFLSIYLKKIIHFLLTGTFLSSK